MVKALIEKPNLTLPLTQKIDRSRVQEPLQHASNIGRRSREGFKHALFENRLLSEAKLPVDKS